LLVLFDDNYAVGTFETASLNGFGVSNDKGILQYSCSEYDWTVIINLAGKTGNERSILGWKLRTRIAAWRSKGGREDNIEWDAGRMCAAVKYLN